MLIIILIVKNCASCEKRGKIVGQETTIGGLLAVSRQATFEAVEKAPLFALRHAQGERFEVPAHLRSW